MTVTGMLDRAGLRRGPPGELDRLEAAARRKGAKAAEFLKESPFRDDLVARVLK